MGDRFSVVLRVRRAQERRAQAEAAQTELAVRAAADEHETRREAHAGRQTIAGDLTPLQLRALQLQGLASYADVAAASKAEDDARRRRNAATAAAGQAAVRRKGAERMVERRADAAAAVAAANAQKALDELSVVRWRDR